MHSILTPLITTIIVSKELILKVLHAHCKYIVYIQLDTPLITTIIIKKLILSHYQTHQPGNHSISRDFLVHLASSPPTQTVMASQSAKVTVANQRTCDKPLLYHTLVHKHIPISSQLMCLWQL